MGFIVGIAVAIVAALLIIFYMPHPLNWILGGAILLIAAAVGLMQANARYGRRGRGL